MEIAKIFFKQSEVEEFFSIYSSKENVFSETEKKVFQLITKAIEDVQNTQSPFYSKERLDEILKSRVTIEKNLFCLMNFSMLICLIYMDEPTQYTQKLIATEVIKHLLSLGFHKAMDMLINQDIEIPDETSAEKKFNVAIRCLATALFCLVENNYDEGRGLLLNGNAEKMLLNALIHSTDISTFTRVVCTYYSLKIHSSLPSILSLKDVLDSKEGCDVFVARSLHEIGIDFLHFGDYNKSLEYMKKGLDMLISLNKDSSNYLRIADHLNGLAIVYKISGQTDLAIKHCYQALDIRKKIYNKPHKKIAMALCNLAVTLMHSRDQAQAIKHLHRARSMLSQLYSEGHLMFAKIYVNLGVALMHVPSLRVDAQAYLEKALVIFRKENADQNYKNPLIKAEAFSHHYLGLVYGYLSKPQQSLEHLENAFKMRLNYFGDTPHEDVANSLACLGEYYVRHFDDCSYRDKGMEYLHRAVKMYEELGQFSTDRLLACASLIRALVDDIERCKDSSLPPTWETVERFALKYLPYLNRALKTSIAFHRIQLCNAWARAFEKKPALQKHMDLQKETALLMEGVENRMIMMANQQRGEDVTFDGTEPENSAFDSFADDENQSAQASIESDVELQRQCCEEAMTIINACDSDERTKFQALIETLKMDDYLNSRDYCFFSRLPSSSNPHEQFKACIQKSYGQTDSPHYRRFFYTENSTSRIQASGVEGELLRNTSNAFHLFHEQEAANRLKVEGEQMIEFIEIISQARFARI